MSRCTRESVRDVRRSVKGNHLCPDTAHAPAVAIVVVMMMLVTMATTKSMMMSMDLRPLLLCVAEARRPGQPPSPGGTAQTTPSGDTIVGYC